MVNAAEANPLLGFIDKAMLSKFSVGLPVTHAFYWPKGMFSSGKNGVGRTSTHAEKTAFGSFLAVYVSPSG